MKPMRFIMILLVCHLSNATWAQGQSNVKGLIADPTGEPLIGVSIQVKGTTTGTVTDIIGTNSGICKSRNNIAFSRR